MPNELCLFGEVGFDVTAVEVKTLLAQMDQTEDLVVRIDSPGGSVFQGFSIHESLAQYPGRKKAVVESAAFSIASYILTAFDDVEIAANGYVMIHNPSMTVDGDDAAFAKASADLKKIRESMVEAYSARMGIPADQVEEMMAAETYYNASEAIAAGFAKSKTEARRSMAVASAKNVNMPKAVSQSLASAGDAGGDTQQPKDRPMANEEKRVATVREIKAIYPNAKAEFIVKCVEKEMTAEEVHAGAMEELQAENDGLKSQMTLLEEEIQNLKAAKDDEYAKAAADDEEAKAEEEAKAKARGNTPVAAGSGPVASARERWTSAIAQYMERGLDRTRAAQKANASHPGLRQQMIEEANAR